jgi:hypothetical protein
MSREENSFHAQIDPISGQVRERDTPLLLTFVDVRFEREAVNSVSLAYPPLMILAIMLVGDT